MTDINKAIHRMIMHRHPNAIIECYSKEPIPAYVIAIAEKPWEPEPTNNWKRMHHEPMLRRSLWRRRLERQCNELWRRRFNRP